MNSDDMGVLAETIQSAENEDSVADLLEQLELQVDCSWQKIGTQQNYTVVFSNAPDSTHAFAELIVNSFDAVLMKRYQQKYGEEYDPDTGLITAKDAAKDLFDDPDDPKSYDEIIEVIATGPNTGETPNLTVRDSGTGQPRELFAERFLNIAAGGQVKDNWPFTQGRFKMGSAAVLPYSGEENYKFIASASVDEPGVWSWTIIRDNPRDGRFEHLLIDGEIPYFEGEMDDLEYGTITTVYNYDLGGVATLLEQGGFRGRLERVLVDPVLPFYMADARGGKTAVVDGQYVRGMYGRLDHWNVERVVKIDKKIRHDFGEPFGERPVRVVVFHPKDVVKKSEGMSLRPWREFCSSTIHRKQAVMYLVNGQAHAYERASFLTGSTMCNFKHTGKTTVAFMDLSDFADKQTHNRRDFLDLFRPSRDTMGGTDIADQLSAELEEALKNDPDLKAEEEWRRSRLTRTSRNELDTEIITSMLEQNPAMSRYFLTGELVQAQSPTPTTTDGGEYEAPYYPTKLKIIEKRHHDGTIELWDEANGKFTKSQPVNHNAQVQFVLDAPNDYFDRVAQRGTLTVDSVDDIETTDWSLHNGVLSVLLAPLTGAEPGDIQQVAVTVSRKMADPLRRVFDIEYSEPVERTGSSGQSSNDPDVAVFDPPSLTEVYREDEGDEGLTTWADMSPEWDEQDIVDIDKQGDEYYLYVNMDAAPLYYYVQSHNFSDDGKAQVREIWKAGVLFYSLAQYIELLNSDVEPDTIVPVTMRGTAQSMLNQHIGGAELDELTV